MTWAILVDLVGSAVMWEMTRYIRWWLALPRSGPSSFVAALVVPVAESLVLGAGAGLVSGAGLFLMARRPARPAVAA